MGDPKVPYFFSSRVKFVFDHSLPKIVWLSENVILFFQRGLVIYFSVITYGFLPSYLADDFTVFFSLGIFGKKKNLKPKLTSIPKFEKILTCLGINHDFLLHGFFFRAKSREKKKTVKFSPSYLYFRPTDSFVCDYRIKKNQPPLLIFYTPMGGLVLFWFWLCTKEVCKKVKW